MEVLISVENLSFQYKNANYYALEDVQLSISRGEWVAIIGHNGSGKSTLAKLMNGLYIPSGGNVLVDKWNTKDESSIWEIRKRVGLVFQNPDNQLVATTVRDDIAFGLENFGVPREVMKEKISSSAHKVGVAHLLDAEPHRLSGGQKQRVAIAGILAVEPNVLILDEATSMLDPMGRKEVIETMKELQQKENISVVSITHDLSEAALADRIIVMNRGRIVKKGTPREIFTDWEDLIGYGLDLPFSLEIALKLKTKGLKVEKLPLNKEELVEELWKLDYKM